MHLNLKLATLGVLVLSTSVFADAGPEVLPTPAQRSVVVAPTSPTPAAAPLACAVNVQWEVFRVYALDRCGAPVKNSGLIGAINRRHSCEGERLIAEILANPNTCETCEARSKVAAIRCERRACNSCDAAHVEAYVGDLESVSRRIRVAGQRSLRLCGYHVTSDLECRKTTVIPAH